MKKSKRKPKDENEMAFNVIARTIGKSEAKPDIDPAVSAAAKALSKLGASKGGKARAQKLSPKKRQIIARKAAIERWKK